jgi:tRNA(fMet)-specific endonuclease VapC
VRYLLDTAVVSDFTRGVPNVLAHLKALRKGDVAISTVTSMEIEYGLMLNPARARKIEPPGTALRRGLVMVTSNGDEFERIHGLALEDRRVA